MISTNLSTRPFYNERLVHAVLAVLGIALVVVAILQVRAINDLSSRDGRLNAQAAQAERKAETARREAAKVRRGIDSADLAAVSAEANEANELIDRRTFSWTRLLTDFGETLPSDVRLSSVAPRFDRDGRMFVDLIVVGRRAEDINAFVEKLEERGFRNVVWRQEVVNPEGLRETTLSGQYVGTARRVG